MSSNKRFNQTLAEMKAVYSHSHRNPISENTTYADAEFCHDLKNEIFTSSWINFKMFKGSLAISNFIKKQKLEKCKKVEATCLLVVGIKNKEGYYPVKGYKNYWLKSKEY